MSTVPFSSLSTTSSQQACPCAPRSSAPCRVCKTNPAPPEPAKEDGAEQRIAVELEREITSVFYGRRDAQWAPQKRPPDGTPPHLYRDARLLHNVDRHPGHIFGRPHWPTPKPTRFPARPAPYPVRTQGPRLRPRLRGYVGVRGTRPPFHHQGQHRRL